VPVFSSQVYLSGYTTLRLGGPAARFADIDAEDDLVAAVRDADAAGDPLLVLGDGSNLVVADDGFPGTVLRVTSSGVSVAASDDGVHVTAQAGQNWGDLVEWAIAEKLSGLECLAGIPGLAGATPIQNVGAYGQEVSTVIESVRVYDRTAAAIATLTGAECGFGYRTSVFKLAQAGPRTRGTRTLGTPQRQGRTSEGPGGTSELEASLSSEPEAGSAPTGRYVVLSVTFRLERSPMSAPVRYAELASKLGISPGEQAPLADVRDAVLELRRGKGMVLDPDDPDTRSAGSFFTNPVLDTEQFARLEQTAAALSSAGIGVPHFAAGRGLVKVPAAWLIEHAGFAKGYPAGGAARISSKHTLALTSRSGASTSDLVALAREIVAGVRSAFGVQLINEPVLVGVTL